MEKPDLSSNSTILIKTKCPIIAINLSQTSISLMKILHISVEYYSKINTVYYSSTTYLGYINGKIFSLIISFYNIIQ